MILEDKIIVDFSLPINKVYTIVQQYDKNSRKITIQLKDKGKALDITNENVAFLCQREDDTYSFLDCKIIDASNGIISILFDENMCIANGVSKAQVILYQEDAVVHSTVIKIRVADSIYEKDIVSSNDFSVFNELLELKYYFNNDLFLTYIDDIEPETRNNTRWIQPIE